VRKKKLARFGRDDGDVCGPGLKPDCPEFTSDRTKLRYIAEPWNG